MKAYLIYPEQFEEMSKQHFQNVAYTESGLFGKEWGTIAKNDNGVYVFVPFSATHLEEDDSISYSGDCLPDSASIPRKAGR